MSTESLKLTALLFLVLAFLFYSCFLYSHLPEKNYPIENEAVTGKLTWQNYNCNACHQIYGLGGYLGPDLTNEYSFRDTNFIKAFLKNGTDIMPNFNLTDEEINALLAYLNTIDRTGKSDPRTFRINTNGTIEQ